MRLTFKFENLYLRLMFVMADNFVFQNPAHRKLAERYPQCKKKTLPLTDNFSVDNSLTVDSNN